MARPLRIEFANAFYHIFSRGNEKKPVFRRHEDYALFLAILKECCERYRVGVHAFCLMSNHFHLLVQTEEANLSSFMKRLIGVYTIKFNYRHKRVGHLFQGRYKAILVQEESYLLELSRYIHSNPCEGGIARAPEDYAYSSMRQYLDGKGPAFLKTDIVLSQFVSPQDYRRFVIEKSECKQTPWEQAVGGVILGSETFVERIRRKIQKKSEDPSRISRSREIFQAPSGKLMESLREERPCVQYYFLWKYGRLTQEKIARMFAITHSAVSQALRRLEQERRDDKVLEARILKMERKMSNVKD